jgi:rRNA maturation protein Nop10
MKQKCDCGQVAQSTKPAKYVAEFKYAHLRRQARREQLEKQGKL